MVRAERDLRRGPSGPEKVAMALNRMVATSPRVLPAADLFVGAIMFSLALALLAGSSRGVVCSNDGSSLALALSLARERTFCIDEYLGLTSNVDLSRRAGKSYSDRPPLTGLLTTIPVLVADRFPGLFVRLPNRTAYIASLLAAVLVSLTATLLFVCGRRIGLSRLPAVWAGAAFVLATPALTYGRVLFIHACSAFLIVVSAWFLIRLADQPAAGAGPWFMLGLVIGLAPVADYVNAVLVPLELGLAVALILLRSRRKTASSGGLLLGVTMGIAVLLGYDYVCFGDPFALSYHYQVRFPWARSFTATFSSALVPGLGRLIHNLVSWSPVVLLAPLGLIPLWRRSRFLGVLWSVPVVLVLTAVAGHRTVLGGGTEDARYAFGIVPCLILIGSFTLEPLGGRLSRSVIGRIGWIGWVLVVLALSGVSSLLSAFRASVFMTRWPSLPERTPGEVLLWIRDTGIGELAGRLVVHPREGSEVGLVALPIALLIALLFSMARRAT